MTIDRMLRRGQFPILAAKPLDESETVEPASAKVYVVEVGAYSDRYIDAIFTTRELAEAFVADRQRRAFEREGRKAHREIVSHTYSGLSISGTATFHSDGYVILSDGQRIEAIPIHRDVAAETFENFVSRHTWNEFGDVEEYDLWDMVPVVPAG